jgi:starch phosphorylase
LNTDSPPAPGREFALDVYPSVPERLSRLAELANNLWYSWHRPTRTLYASLDRELWRAVGHNPKLFLRRIDERILAKAAEDDVYLANYNLALSAYDTYHQERSRAAVAEAFADDDLIAYLCAEYGLHESLHVYSGGLGILAGHHCKMASDMRLPFVAVGLLYHAGYFSQAIDDEGIQIANYVEADFDELPISPAKGADGQEIRVAVEIAEREVIAKVWQARAGHALVYLLDTNVEPNTQEDRRITYKLYDGDEDRRLEQEILLGVGGVRALRALGHAPTVWHLNEGHPAFSILERVRELTVEGQKFPTALEAVAASTVFTTHTPVPAGHDYFALTTVEHYLAPMLRELGIDSEAFQKLGCLPGNGSELNMTTLAIRGSRHHNGVSRVHGMVASSMCAPCWPQVPAAENPMGYVTNGVHIPTVLAQDWLDLFDRSFGSEWRNHLSDRHYWQRVHSIPDDLFWSVHQSIKSRMLAVLRDALLTQHRRNQVSEPHIDRLLKYVDPADPDVLIVGFARRFATYKRATLLFNDLAWLGDLLGNQKRPVVFVFAGKAHPADEPGRQLIQRIHEVSCMPEFVGKVLLVEGYGLALARKLVAGVDVWLNNPVYATEASGTSGMKAAVNGAINLSVTDGWWAEGFEGDNGWAIKPSPHRDDEARRDAEDARTLYEILQDHVIPLYYQRGKYNYSPGWVAMAKRSMASVLPRFNMRRVLEQYTTEIYLPAAVKGRALRARDYAGAEILAIWKSRVQDAWPDVSLRRLDNAAGPITFGQPLYIEVAARLGGLEPHDVRVELLLSSGFDGEAVQIAEQHLGEPSVSAGDADAPARTSRSLAFEASEPLGENGEHRFSLELRPEFCGRYRYRIRVYPSHEFLSHPMETGLLTWLE